MSELRLHEVFSSIQGEGLLAGRRQIFVRLSGCNLRCSYCDTDHAGESGYCLIEERPGAGSFSKVERPVRLETLLATVSRWTDELPGAHHSISVTGGEPLLAADILTAWLPGLRECLPIHLETNGTLPDALQGLVHLLDYISMDIKLPSVSGQGELWEAHGRFLEIGRGRGLSVKAVVGRATPPAEIERVCRMIAAVDPAIPLFLQPLTLPDGRLGIENSRILRLQERAAALIGDVRVIPQMHKLIGVL